MSDNETCFEQQAFARFLEERSEEGEETRILAHIGNCDKCRDMLENLAGHSGIFSDIQEHLAEHDLDHPTQSLTRQQRELSTVRNLIGPSEDPEMLGRLGNYEICGIVGRGSAGIVVKALDTRLNRYVAIKLLAPAYANHGCSRRRFERECKAIASVKNPNVVEIHTVEEFNGTPYIVMPYVPNGSLQKRIQQKGPLTVNEVVCVGMQIASGLSAAHERGIVHRDVKPANVLLENGIEGAKVSDFGLARVVDEATMTYSGTISGTPQYMSPEQAKGERVDQRSDLFSLGSTLYTACTGHAPFSSESVFGIIKKVCDSQPKPIRESNPDIPAWLVAFIEKLHSKEPRNRFESSKQVAGLLAGELAHLQSPTRIPEPNRHWWKKEIAPTKLVQPVPPLKHVIQKSYSPWLLAACILFTAIASGLIGSKFFGGGSGGEVINSSSWNSPSMPDLLVMMQQENEKLPRFDREIKATIDVKPGGQLWFDSNLGTVEIEAHDEPTVEMKAIHSVSAKSEEQANEFLKAVKFSYKPDDENQEHSKYKKGRDAIISARFPTKSKITEKEIREFDDLEELKKQLLMRNHNSFRKVKFKLLIPEFFNLNVQTGGGGIVVDSFDGNIVATTRGGHITTQNLSGQVELVTHGGAITIGDAAESAKLLSYGGRIKCGDIGEHLTATTHGGDIFVSAIAGTAKVKSHGGGITIRKASADINALTHAGSVNVNFVEQPRETCKIETHAGSIRVGYVDGLAFNINARCDLGKVSAPFSKKKSSSLKHKLNNGDVGLKLVSHVGSINLQQVDEDDIPDEMRFDKKRIDEGRAAFNKAYDLHMDGRINEAIIAHQKAAEYADFKGIATYNLGCAWSLKGEKEKAFKALYAAIDYGFTDVNQYETDSDLDPLRDDERFDDLMELLNDDWQDSPSDELEAEAEHEDGEDCCCDDECDDEDDEDHKIDEIVQFSKFISVTR